MPTNLTAMLKASQQTVVDVGTTSFYKYQQGLLTANALPQYGSPGSRKLIRAALKQSGGMLLRWQEYSAEPSEWWTMVCRETSLSSLKKKTRWTSRKNIKKGLELFDVLKADAQFVCDNAYQSHCEAYSRYANARPQSAEEFGQDIMQHAQNQKVEFWVCKESAGARIVGWCMYWLDGEGAFLHTIDIAPSALSKNAGYAFISSCLDEYVTRRNLPVSNGTRSVSHATGMQDFLRKLGFRKEYGRLHVEYTLPLALAVQALMPLRRLIPRIGALSLVRAVLEQEKLARDCQPPSMFSRVAKRVFDFTFAAIGVCLLGWLMIICWCLARLDTKANGFFIQSRVGRNGQTFPLLKFRSMRYVAGVTTTVTTANDSRITKFGSLLRATKLDELPQLLNVLCGHMSLVGPRPDVSGWADELSGEDAVILDMRPGVTGPASLHFRHEEQLLAEAADAESYNRDKIWPEKVSINRRYYYQQSFLTDLKILIKTVFTSREQ